MKHLDEKSLCLQPPDVTECPYKYNAALCESREVRSIYARFRLVMHVQMYDTFQSHAYA